MAIRTEGGEVTGGVMRSVDERMVEKTGATGTGEMSTGGTSTSEAIICQTATDGGTEGG